MATYRELAPPAALARHVTCLWFQTTDEASHHRVVPDACADIVAVSGQAPVVAGPATAAQLVPLPARSLVVGLRFRPGAAPSLLKISARELLDDSVPLAELWPADGARLGDDIESSRSAGDRLGTLAAAIIDKLPDADPLDPVVTGAVRWLARHPDGRVKQLAAALGLGDRQLLRRFDAAVGYGPKVLQRVLRFQRLLVAAANTRKHTRLAELAATAGYIDQPHMTRDVRELTGVTPGELLTAHYEPTAMAEFLRACDAV